MSSVVIAGDVSGSVTLQAPSTAGTTVLTLPATSGTVVTTATSTGISGSAITTGTVGVSVGGTGVNTLTANNVILGNDTSAVQFVAPGSSGNVLTSNGTTWTSAAAGGGSIQTQIFTSPGTWTKPSTVTQVRVTVVAGGGGGASPAGYPGSGGTGGSSSFGSIASATGGSGCGPNGVPSPGNPGGGTVSSGTALRTGAVTYKNAPTVYGVFTPGVQNFVGSGKYYNNSSASGQTWSTGVDNTAGASGGDINVGFGGGGGIAMAIAPVSSPVPVAVGTGGPANNPASGPYGGGGGIVIVEWVG